MSEIVPCVTGVLLSIGIIVIIRSRYNKDDWPTDLIVCYISRVVHITYAWKETTHQYFKEEDTFWKAASVQVLNWIKKCTSYFCFQFNFVMCNVTTCIEKLPILHSLFLYTSIWWIALSQMLPCVTGVVLLNVILL